MNLGNKILEKRYNYNIYRVICDLKVYNEPQILQVLIGEISGPLIS
jgi:hypothetical protein